MGVISEEELQEIVEVVWMTALELSIEPGGESDLAMSDYTIAEIRISGAWSGVVSVRASDAFLQHAAAKMFSSATEDLTDLDLTDSLTELTNMLGGTVKCLLPEVCDLSLPVIIDNDVDSEVDHDWTYFTCEGKPLAVVVEQKEGDAQQAA